MSIPTELLRFCRHAPTLLLASLAFLAPGMVQGETPQRLNVEIDGVDGELRSNVEAFLRLMPLTDPDASLPGESRLRWLHLRAEEDIRDALQPFGYYRPEIDSELSATPEGWLARYRIDPGPPLPLTELDLRISGSGADDPAFQRLLDAPLLTVGQTLDHRHYERLRTNLQAVATDRGYFDARFSQSRILIDLETYQATVVIHYDTGERYRFGEVGFRNGALLPSFLQRFVNLEPGQPYSASALLQLQTDLTTSEYFDLVLINASPETAENFEIPVLVDLTMRSRSKFTFGLGYATDTGARGRAGVERRWVNRRGHKFEAQALISQIRYGIGTVYTIPGTDPRNDAYLLRARIDGEDSARKDSLTGAVGFSRRFQRGQWNHLLSLDYQWERFTAGAAERRTTRLLIPSARSSWISADDRLQVRRGRAVTLELRGASDAVLSDVTFLQGSVGARWIQALDDKNRILLRGQAGTTAIEGGQFPLLPTSIRFFAGGDASVRGYALDSIAPRDAEGRVVGGRHLLVGSIEFDHRFRDNWSVAAFVDAGDAFDNEAPNFRTGAGVGLRWQSPVGPVRLDLAHGFDNPGDSFRIHFSLGPEL